MVILDAFVKSFTFQKFEPSGMVVGGSGRVKMATSIVDYIFREFAITHLNRGDLAHDRFKDLDTTSTAAQSRQTVSLPWGPNEMLDHVG